MRRPNFFILGAPKCGTTSLAAWLAEHPRIFMPGVKEPHFFNTDERCPTGSLAEYEALFGAVTAQHQAVGEASVWYLHSRAAVPNILAYRPDARFIVMIRNPLEMAPALHAEMRLAWHEKVADFRTAWELQEHRRDGRSPPLFDWARSRLLYGEACSLGAQMERLFGSVPRHRVQVIVLDDLIADPRRIWLSVLRFLGVEDDGRTRFPVHNRARIDRHPGLTRALFSVLAVKERLGIRPGLGLWGRIARANTIEAARPALSAEMTDMLRDYFAPDVARLGRLLGRDFGPWLGGPPIPGRTPAPSDHAAAFSS